MCVLVRVAVLIPSLLSVAFFLIIIPEVRLHKIRQVCKIERRVECRRFTMKYYEHCYSMWWPYCNRCPSLLLCVFGRLPNGVIDYVRCRTATQQLAAGPGVTALV